jgi:murein DD-endopeptidase MepM/ murein hydrolase activator NlpD
MPTDDTRDLSHDPRTWLRQGGPASAPEAPPQIPESDGPQPAKRSVLPLAAAGLVVLAMVGGGAFFLLRGPAGAPAGGDAAPAAQGEAVERRVLVVPDATSLGEVLSEAGAPADQVAAAIAAAAPALAGAKGELRLTASLARDGEAMRLLALEARAADGSGVSLTGAGAGYTARPLVAELKTEVRVVRGEMDAESFYSSAVAAGVHDSLISDFAAAFAFDFDFQREIRPGDVFEAAFEQTVDADGAPTGVRRLVYASLSTAEKSRALYRFTPPGKTEGGWFDGAGRSIVRNLMRTPVDGARISSSFGPRMHPVLGYTRVHKGTDFAVGIGTTVYASGDGVAIIAGVGHDFGNWVRLQHKDGLTTTYAHLSKIADGVRVGAQVRQGQVLGLSGNSGLSSGPHLHYELAVGGAQVDPMTYVTRQGETLGGAGLKAFQAERDRIDALRAKAM